MMRSLDLLQYSSAVQKDICSILKHAACRQILDFQFPNGLSIRPLGMGHDVAKFHILMYEVVFTLDAFQI
jgi:hypothetical protein